MRNKESPERRCEGEGGRDGGMEGAGAEEEEES